MDRKSGHLTGTETAEACLLNGPKIVPDMARKSVTQYNRVAETLSTQKENNSTCFDLESESTARKNSAKNRPERLDCGHALPWIDEFGESRCVGCDSPPEVRMIEPTAAAVRAFCTSAMTSEWPGGPEGWK